MARIVDGKVVLDVNDSDFVNTLIDVKARNAARDRDKKREPAPVRAANTG